MRVVAIAVLFAFAAPQLPAGTSLNLYSHEKEMSLGRQMALEVERQTKLFDDPTVMEYVNRIGQRIAKQADTSFPVVIRVIQSGEVNAFTLPGGHIFVNTGMLRLTESEAELASVLAHEIGHVAGRHLTRQASRSDLLRTGLIPVFGMGGISGMLARQITALGLPLGTSHFSREFEVEADHSGVQYLLAAGYDPGAAIDLLERVESAEQRRPGTVARMYGSHPPTADRIARVTKVIARMSTSNRSLAINTSEYEEVRRRLPNSR